MMSMYMFKNGHIVDTYGNIIELGGEAVLKLHGTSLYFIGLKCKRGWIIRKKSPQGERFKNMVCSVLTKQK